MNNKANMRKRLIALGIVGAIVAGIILGVCLYIQYRNDQKTVNVLPVGNVAESYWGDQISTSGQIVSDYVQQLYPDSGKTISEVFVTEGQQVSIGTPLLQYDKTSLELDVEAKEIEVKQVDVKIDEAQRQLKKLQNTRPASNSTPRPTRKPGSSSTSTPRPTRTPAATKTPKPSPTKTPTPSNSPIPTPDVGVYSQLDLDSIPYKGTGTTDDPYVFLCKNGYALTPAFFRHMLGLDNATTPTPEPTAQPTPEPTPEEPDATEDPGSQMEWTAEGEDVGEMEKEDEAGGETVTDPDQVGENGFAQESPEPGTKLVSPFAAVFEVREQNSNYGNLVSSLKIDGTNYSAALTLNGLFNGMTAGEIVAGGTVEPQPKGATPTPKPTNTPKPSATPSNNYNDMGYTSAELNQMIKEKRREITNFQHDLKQANLDLEKAKRALENSTVLSTMDGQVTSLVDLDTALAENKPLLVVSGEQQYYVSGTISEAWLGSVNVGDTITVNSWMTGQTYSAQIVSISDYPAEQEGGYFGGESNPNSSSYEFTGVIQNPDDSLTANDYNYVDITMDVQDTTSAEGLYLQRPYLREDDSGYYVMKAGKNNRLVKQYVLVGKAIWGGQNMEIKSGLTYDDFVAFPYGPDVREGVRVVLEGTEGEKPWPDGLEEDPVSSGLLEDGAMLPEDGLTPAPDDGMVVTPEDGISPDGLPEENFGTDSSAVGEESSAVGDEGTEGTQIYTETGEGGVVIP